VPGAPADQQQAIKDQEKKDSAAVFIKAGVGGFAAVASAVTGSAFGDKGTLIGTAIGAVVCALASEGAGWAVARSRERATKFHASAGRALTAGLIALVALPLLVTGVEAATHKPLHAIVTGGHEKGYTFLGDTSRVPAHAPVPAPSRTATWQPSPARSTRSVVPSALPSGLPSPSFSPAQPDYGVTSSSLLPTSSPSPVATVPAGAPSADPTVTVPSSQG
jgi:hypothetical protein